MTMVNIYIESTWHGPSRGAGTYAFVMEFRTSTEPVTLTKCTSLPDCSENTAVVKAAAEAVKRLNSKCDVNFYTSNRYFNGCVNEYLARWRVHGFNTTRGTPIANQEEWRIISDATAGVTAEDGFNEYRNYLRTLAGHTSSQYRSELTRREASDEKHNA